MTDGCTSCSDRATPTRAQVSRDASGSHGIRVDPAASGACSGSPTSAYSRRVPATAAEEASPTGAPCTHVVDDSGSSATISRFSTAPADVQRVEVVASRLSGAIIGVKAISSENCTLTMATMGAPALETGDADTSTVLVRDGTAVRVPDRVIVKLAETPDGLGVNEGDDEVLKEAVGERDGLAVPEGVTVPLHETLMLPLSLPEADAVSDGLSEGATDALADAVVVCERETLGDADAIAVLLVDADMDVEPLDDKDGVAATVTETLALTLPLTAGEKLELVVTELVTVMLTDTVAAADALPLAETEAEPDPLPL